MRLPKRRAWLSWIILALGLNGLLLNLIGQDWHKVAIASSLCVAMVLLAYVEGRLAQLEDDRNPPAGA